MSETRHTCFARRGAIAGIGRSAVFGLAVLFLCLTGPARSAAAADSPLAIDGGAVDWSRLTFRAPSRPDDLSAEVRLVEIAPERLADLLLPSPGSEPVVPVGASVLQMTSTINVFVTGRAYRTEILFDPTGLSPLQRIRDKTGSDANRKVYRYLAEDVRRRRIEPDGRAEANLAPEHWTHVKDHVYPFGAARAACPTLTDPNLLLLLVSAGAVTPAVEPLALCVFNKKGIHEVRLSADPEATLAADYLEIRGATRTELRRDARVRRIRIEAVLPKLEGLTPDPFEFFEMGGEIEIDLDADSGLPLRIGGEISGFGRVEFLLGEVEWRR
jgi:hypothetical protein